MLYNSQNCNTLSARGSKDHPEKYQRELTSLLRGQVFLLVCSLPTATLPTWGCSCWLLLIAILLLGVHVCVPLLFDKPPDDDAFTSLPLHNSLLEACSLFATAVILLCELQQILFCVKTPLSAIHVNQIARPREYFLSHLVAALL